MSFKVYDFCCDTCSLVEEHIVWKDETIKCLGCNEEMRREIPAPMGNVKWSENPVLGQKKGQSKNLKY